LVVLLYLYLYRVKNRVYLSHGEYVTGAAWHAVIRIVVGVGDLVQRTEDGHIGRVLGGRAIERSGDVMCGLHRARGDKKHMFLG
jgi:hypothetical protein